MSFRSSPRCRRGRARIGGRASVAAVNSLSYIWDVGGSLATMILLQLVRLSEPMALVVLGFANIAAAVYFFRRLPANIPAFCLRAIGRLLFRLEVVGQENLVSAGAPNIIAVDARLLARRADPVLAHGDARDFRDRRRPQRRAGPRGSFFGSPMRVCSIPPSRSPCTRSCARPSAGRAAGSLPRRRDPRSPASRWRLLTSRL